MNERPRVRLLLPLKVLASYRARMENLREALEIAASHFVESTGMVDKVSAVYFTHSPTVTSSL